MKAQTAFIQTTNLNENTVYYVKRADRWTNKRVYWINEGSTEMNSQDFSDNPEVLKIGQKVSSKKFDQILEDRYQEKDRVRKQNDVYYAYCD